MINIFVLFIACINIVSFRSMMMMNCLYCFLYGVEVPDRFGPAEVEDDEDEDDG